MRVALALTLPAVLHAQERTDSAYRADSSAVAKALAEIRADSVRTRDQALISARSTLSQPVLFPAGSTRLTPDARMLVHRKAWFLFLNPELKVRLSGRADAGLTDYAARQQARERVDTVRGLLRERGIDLERVGVDEGESNAGSPADAGRVEFAVTGTITVVEIPPASADPPPLERATGQLGPTAWRRYRWGTVRIFYGTDRRRSGNAAVESFYGGEESENGALEFGRIQVSVPRMHRPGIIERPVWYRLERDTDPRKHMMVRAIQPLKQAVAFDSLRAAVGRSGGKEALVFIHGYNVTFHDAALRTAQLTYDLGFDGAPILYSWPSRGSPFRYAADQESAEWSAEHLSVFLDSVVAITGAKRVHLIAHSMGNMVLMRALSRMALIPGRDTLFNNLVLAAPDVPANMFQQQFAPSVRPLARRLTIYISGKDKALWASRLLSDHLRLGEASSPILVVRETDTIDASGIATDLLGHGYIASSKDLIDDLVLLLQEKRPPPRGRLKAMNVAGSAYWKFP